MEAQESQTHRIHKRLELGGIVVMLYNLLLFRGSTDTLRDRVLDLARVS